MRRRLVKRARRLRSLRARPIPDGHPAFTAGVAKALDLPEVRVRALFAEARAAVAGVPAGRLRRRTRTLVPWIAWYAAVRERKPTLVVVTGVRQGHGSLLVLEALERNAREGVAGRLVSFDLDPSAGGAVPAERREGWDLVIGRSPEAIAPALRGEEVEMLIHDTPPIPELERAEYELALAHGADAVMLVDGSNGEQTGVLRSLAREHGAEYHLVREGPAGPACAFALIEPRPEPRVA